MMIDDWYEIRWMGCTLFLIVVLCGAAFILGRNIGETIAEPHQCISVCEEYFEGWNC